MGEKAGIHGELSCLHWIISLSFCWFLCNGVYYDTLNLFVNDVIVGQKGSNGDGKLHFFGRNCNFTRCLCPKIYCNWMC